MSTGVIACGAIATHISAISQRLDKELTIYPLPPLLHNQPEKIAGEVESLFLRVRDQHQRILVGYADCGTYGALDLIVEKYGLRRIGGNHCYDMFAGQQAIESMMSEESGTYFLTDFLVRSFERTVVAELGLDRYPELRDDYFRHYNRVVWLAQNPTADLRALAERAAQTLQLPLEVRVVGEVILEKQLLELLD